MKARLNSDEARHRATGHHLRWLLLCVPLLACGQSGAAATGSEKIPSAGGNPPVIDEQPIARAVTADVELPPGASFDPHSQSAYAQSAVGVRINTSTQPMHARHDADHHSPDQASDISTTQHEP